MPELPEVETMRRGVARLAGSRIEQVEFIDRGYRPIAVAPARGWFRRRAVGRVIVAFDRLGKRVLARLDDASAIVFEPRMTGLVLLADPPDWEHLRLRLTLADRDEPLMFWDRRGLGSVRLLNAKQLASAYGPDKLGPDALAVNTEQLRERFRGCRREVKPALLDQRLLAGVGNLYASELLHVAGVDPRRRCHELTGPQWRAIGSAMRRVLDEAIRHEGSTLSDGTYRNALNQQGGYQNHHRVYDREGRACPTCRVGAIRRIVQAQRSTFFCPACQAASGRGRRGGP